MKKKFITIMLLFILSGGAYYVKQYRDTIQGETLTIYGNVDIRDVNLGFRVFGRISKLNCEEGDRVKEGDTLAILDKVPYEEDVTLSKAQLDLVSANLINKETLYKRSLQQFQVKAISQNDLDTALSIRDQAKASVEAAKAQLDKSLTNLEDTEIRAPNDGIILTRVREPGSVVLPGNTVYTLMVDHPIWIRTYVDEPNLGRIYPGQKATVLTDSGDRYEGWVGYISPQAEFTPKTVETTQLRSDLVYRLRIIIDKGNNGLRQGMPVTVILKKEPKR